MGRPVLSYIRAARDVRIARLLNPLRALNLPRARRIAAITFVCCSVHDCSSMFASVASTRPAAPAAQRPIPVTSPLSASGRDGISAVSDTTAGASTTRPGTFDALASLAQSQRGKRPQAGAQLSLLENDSMAAPPTRPPGYQNTI